VSRGGKFIWLPDQPVNHAAAFASLRSAPARRTDEGVNRWILARRRFSLDSAAIRATLNLTTDGQYLAWINGRRIGSGPVRSAPWCQRVNQHPVAGALVPGNNVIAVLIHVPGIDLAWYETMKGGWQPAFGDGALFAELRIETASSALCIVSDETWRMCQSTAWRRDTERAGWGLGFIEDFDANQLDPAWTSEAYDDAAWSTARIMRTEGDAVARARGWGPVMPFPLLQPAEIPQATESRRLPDQILWIRPVDPAPQLPLQRRLYEERLLQPDNSLGQQLDALLDGSGSGATVITRTGSDTALMVAFSPCHAGRPFLEIEAHGGEIIDVAVDEAVPGQFGRGACDDGLRRQGDLQPAHLFRYHTRPGRQYFEAFNRTSIRAMQLVVRNAPRGIRLLNVGTVATHYPARVEASFTCSDATLTRLWNTAQHTVLQCMHDAWVDCPGREGRQWVGDAVVQFDVAACAFGPSVYPLQRQFLRQVAESQRQDGLVRMFAPGDTTADSLVIPDFTLLWVIGAARYHQLAADIDCIEIILPAIERALAWFERLRGRDGLLCDLPHWHFIEWAALGRDGQSAPVNALWVGALDACAYLSGEAGRTRLANHCKDLRDGVARALNERHWDETRGLYVDSVDPATGARGLRTSQHTNALLMLFGIAPRERWPRMLDAITDERRLRLTAAPPIVPQADAFDERQHVVRANSFFAHFIYDAIARAGRSDWVLRDMLGNFGPMLQAGATTLWESFSPAASLCHGFSATPAYQLTRHVLGIQPPEPGETRMRIRPDPGALEWAQGTYSGRCGALRIEWRRTGPALVVTVDHAEACPVLIEAPAGHRIDASLQEPTRTWARILPSGDHAA